MKQGSQKHIGPGKPPRRKRSKPDMLRRLEAVEKTKARFGGKEFVLGSNDCYKMARFHLKAMGHENIPSGGHYSTPREARTALNKAGSKSIKGLLDGLLERIPPASMLLGDIALLKGQPERGTAGGLGSLVVHLGGKMLGWHPDATVLAVMDVMEVEAAWRA